MRKNKVFTIGLVLFMGLQLVMVIPFLPSQFVSADIDTLTLEDDFEEKYYNNIYSQYENASIVYDFSNSQNTTLRPNGVGTFSNLNIFGDTPAWRCVDEDPTDENTTRVYPNNDITEYDTYQAADHTTEVEDITNVRIYVRAFEYGGQTDFIRTVIRVSSINYYGSSTPIINSYQDYYTDYLLNPEDNEVWEWSDIDAIEIGIEMTNDDLSPRCTQVYIVVYYETGTEIGSTTTYKQQDTSYYRAYGGLYSYFHNVSRNHTEYEVTVKHNSSIIINFVTLNIFPQAMSFFIYFNCYYNISLFIGEEEHVLLTHDYSIDDWKYIGIRLNRRDYLITDLNADFYLKIYPIENNNTHDVFYMDNLKVKYTDPEPVINYRSWCHGGEEYNDWVLINDTTSSFYAITTDEHPAGWLEDGTSDKWAYRTASNRILSRGMTLYNAWTLHDWEVDNTLVIFTDINFTTDREYYISDVTYFFNNVGNGLSQVNRILRLFIDNVNVYDVGNFSFISDSSSFLGEYYELSHKVELVQINEHTMQYASSFANLFTNITDWRPMIFPINEDIQVGFNIMRYTQQTQYVAGGSASTNPIIFQKTLVDIHNTPISDLTIPDIEGGFFRNIWNILMDYIGEYTGLKGLIWQWEQLERAYQEAMIDVLNDIVEGIDTANWLDDFYNDIQDIQDTYADGIVSTWRNLFNQDDMDGLSDRFDLRWGSRFERAARGETSIFTKIIGRIFGEDVGIIPQLIWQFFINFKNWAVIGFVMFIVMFMKALMKRDYDRVKGIVSGSISVIMFIVKMIQWIIGFVIKILTMIGGFIPFT